MARPSKAELLHRFFPELRQSGSKGDKEQALSYSALSCEVILADLLRLFDQGLKAHGRGALTLRLQQGQHSSAYVSLADFQADLEQAQRQQADAMADFLSEVVRTIEATNLERAGLLLLIDNSGAQLFPVDRERPAGGLRDLMEAYSNP